jgi:hypothetical protein
MNIEIDAKLLDTNGLNADSNKRVKLISLLTILKLIDELKFIIFLENLDSIIKNARRSLCFTTKT